jgi:hypothetical protein
LKYLREYFEKHENEEFVSFCFGLLDPPSIYGITMSIILSNIYGKDEPSPSRNALLTDQKNVLPFLVHTLDATMNYDREKPLIKELQKKGFKYGELQMRNITGAFKNLSLSDENKKAMIKLPKLVDLLGHALKAFVENTPQYQGNP